MLSVGFLLSELSAVSDTSAVGRLFPLVLLALGVLIVVAVVLGLKNRAPDRDEDERRG